MKRTLPIRGYLFIIISAVIYGCMPLMANYIYLDGVNSLTLVLLRNLLSLPVIFILGILSGQSFRARPVAIGSAVLIGIFGCAVTPLLLFSSYSYISGGTATVFHFVYPAVVLVFELFVLRTKARWGSILAIAICVVGIVMFYDPTEGVDLVGGILALSSGVTYAVYIVLLGKFGTRGMGAYVFGFFAALGSTVILLVTCLASGQLALPRTVGGWLLCIIFAAAVNGGAVILFQRGTVLIGGQRASVLSTFEPLTSVIVGYLVFSEPIGWQSGIGIILVLGASVLIAILGGDDGKKKNATPDAEKPTTVD